MPIEEDMSELSHNRPLTAAEYDLAYEMLLRGIPEARAFLDQLQNAEVASHCPCGCASIYFQIRDYPAASPGVHILGDYLFGPEDAPSGIFIYESGGILSGLEVYGLAGDAPQILPSAGELRPFRVG